MARRDPEKKTGTAEYAAFMLRILRAYGTAAKADELDTTSLEQLRALRVALDHQTGEVVRALHSGGYSWQDIGDALGMDRSNAAKRYGAPRITGR